MPNLFELILFDNSLTGSLPTRVSQTLRDLSLGSNSLSGTVSSSLFSAQFSIVYVDLLTTLGIRSFNYYSRLSTDLNGE